MAETTIKVPDEAKVTSVRTTPSSSVTVSSGASSYGFYPTYPYGFYPTYTVTPPPTEVWIVHRRNWNSTGRSRLERIAVLGVYLTADEALEDWGNLHDQVYYLKIPFGKINPRELKL